MRLVDAWVSRNGDARLTKEYLMCNNHKWQTGQTVKAGFVSGTVKATLGDGSYILSSVSGLQLYRFVPHNGLHKISAVEAKALLDRDAARLQSIRSKINEMKEERLANEAVFAGQVC